MVETRFAEFSGKDLSVAEWLAGELKGEWRYDHTAKRWHHWDNVRWAPDQTRQIVYAAASAASSALMARVKGQRQFSDDDRKAIEGLMNMPAQSRVLEALSSLPGYGTNGDDWDQDENLLGCPNGIVDLRLNALLDKPSPEDLVTKTTGVAFHPLAGPEDFETAAPIFMQVISDWMSGDADMVAFLLLWFGASLFGFSPEQRFLLMTGIGRNGKGALKNSVLHAAGDYAGELDHSLYMRSKSGAARSDQARADLLKLKGLRIAFFSEPPGGKFNEELLKGHTGGDRITARALYSNNLLSWDPTHSITFLTNDAPALDDLGPSMASRVMVADFRERFDGAREDKRLYDKLKAEKVGILGILCWAAAAWHRDWAKGGQGITLPARVVEQSKAFMERNDPVANWLNERAAFGASEKTAGQLAYESFLNWCRMNGVDDTPSNVKFAQLMEKKGFAHYRSMSARGWVGFRLLGAVDIAEREGSEDDDADEQA